MYNEFGEVYYDDDGVYYDDSDDYHDYDDEWYDVDEEEYARLGRLRAQVAAKQKAEEEKNMKKERDSFQIAQQNLSKGVRSHAADVGRAMATMYDNELFSDVTLIVGERTFHAHRLILSAWSDVFKTMLCNASWQQRGDHSGTDTAKTTAPKTQELLEEECCVGVFDDFLKFLYTTSVDLTKANVLPLILLADKYLVKELRDLCDEFIHNIQGDAQEVVSFIQSASQFGMRETVMLCLQSLLCNFSLLTQEQLLTLESEHLRFILDSGPKLVVDDEYTLFKKIEPWLDQCQSKDTFLDVIELIRFPYMNALQLKRVSQTAAFRRAQEMKPEILLRCWQQQAFYQEGNLKDLPEDFPHPRLYIDSNIETKFLGEKFGKVPSTSIGPTEVKIGSRKNHIFIPWVGILLEQNLFFKQKSMMKLVIETNRSAESPSEVTIGIQIPEARSIKRLHFGVKAEHDGKFFYMSACFPSVEEPLTVDRNMKCRFAIHTGISNSEMVKFHFAAVLGE